MTRRSNISIAATAGRSASGRASWWWIREWGKRLPARPCERMSMLSSSTNRDLWPAPAFKDRKSRRSSDELKRILMDHPTDRDEALLSFHKKRGELIEANKYAAPSARAFLQRQKC